MAPSKIKPLLPWSQRRGSLGPRAGTTLLLMAGALGEALTSAENLDTKATMSQ